MHKKSIDLESASSKYDAEPFFQLLDLNFERPKALVQHHIDSFNQFIDEIIPSIVEDIPHMIQETITPTTVYRNYLKFTELGLRPPSMDNDEEFMFPLDAIHKNLTYASKYTATVTQYLDTIDIGTNTTKTEIVAGPEKDVPIGKIPIMVGSKYCNLTRQPGLAKKHCKYDDGGYFIIGGNEKIVLSIETSRLRMPLVFTHKEQNVVTFYVKVQSRPDTQFVGNNQMFTIKIKKDESLVVVAPRFKEVSIFTFMRALGFEQDEDIVDSITDRNNTAMINQLSRSMNSQNSPTMSREEAIETLVANMKSTKNFDKNNSDTEKKQKREYLIRILSKEILPHVTSDTGNAEIDMLYKAYYIGYMINKLFRCYLKNQKGSDEIKGCDDRDSMINKRIELSGVLLGGLFEQCFKKTLNDCNKSFKSKGANVAKPPNIISLIKPNAIEQGIRQALSTGLFVNKSVKGLSQMLNRMNHLHSASYKRRVITPTVDASKNKMTSPRHLHNTQYGSMCPLETPEGPKTGIVKNMSMLENITISSNTQIPIIKKFLENKIITLDSINKKKLHRYVKVFLNGSWLGVTNKITDIHHALREMRFNGDIEKTVSLVFDYKNEFHIYTEGGRLIRPYLTVTNNKLNFKPEMLKGIRSWDEFIARYPRVIEYIDKEEEQNIMLAIYPEHIERARKIMMMKPKKNPQEIDRINRTNRYDNNVYQLYTHCEIHPCMILGLISSNIPFPNHNQSPRGIFQYNQARQAMGLYISDYRERTDISYILYHPQIPLVTSRASKYTGTHVFPVGENSIVSIASYTGYNQEDSLLVNKSAIEKGFQRALAFKKYFETIKKNTESSKLGEFMKPDKNKVDGLKDANYSKLNEKGYVDVETVINDGDVIIGMAVPKQARSDKEKSLKDNSTIYKSLVPGTIDKVITGNNNDGYPIIKLRVRSERIPAVGDKFSCYDNQTEILTSNGWKYFKNLDKTDHVATLVDGQALVYEKPFEIQSYPYYGPLYSVTTSEIDLMVTPNHNMWVNDGSGFHLERAENIVGKHFNYQKNVLEYLPFDSSKINLFPCKPHWLSFYGIYLGSTSVIDNDTLTLTMNSNANSIMHYISDKCGYQIKSHTVNNQVSMWVIADRELVTLLDQIDTSVNQWLCSLTTAECKMISTMILTASGVVSTKGEFEVASAKRVDQIQRLFIHAGLVSDIIKTDDSNRIRVGLTVEISTTSVNRDTINDKWEEYCGLVYCCTVKSGVVCVRRNGKVTFASNSRAGQKGTVGYKIHRADLPFSENGLVPDIIVNPNAIPKRMTIGQLIECLMSKNCAIKGVYGDATPFMRIDIHAINKELIEAGFKEWGCETMYNGMTGQKMLTDIFIGPTYYQRLKQMVGDKAHSRASGPTQLLTRQPTEGRTRDGGFRFGEMERDGICAHGASQTQKERMVDGSDIYYVNVCDICGTFTSKVPEKKFSICKLCNNSTKITTVVLPYAFKLLIQELMSINILGRIRTSNSINITDYSS